MLNRIWFFLLLIGVLYAPAKAMVMQMIGAPAAAADEAPEEPGAEPVEELAEEQPSGVVAAAEAVAEAGKRVTTAAIDGANVAVEVCLSLIGIMVLWLGLMQVAKDAGLVDGLARMLSPLMRWLFPEVPDGHPAQGAMLMNISANVLGLDNAATPFGLRAMQELQDLNDDKETATNSMATFLAINTSSVTLVPISIIGLRVAAGSENPAGPVFGMILATMVSTCVAIVVVRALSKLPAFAKPAKPTGEAPTSEGEDA